MKCSCCQPYDAVFDEKRAQRDAKRYKKKGLTKETKILFDFLRNEAKGKSVLEIGSGIGDLGAELIKSDAVKYAGADISKAYINEANKFITENSLDDKMRFLAMDFVKNSKKLGDADIVVSNKVICCYPDMPRFIDTTIKHAKKFYGIVYPRDGNFVVYLFAKLLNFVVQFTKMEGFRFYVHDNEKIIERIESKKFKLFFKGSTFMWNVGVWWRD